MRKCVILLILVFIISCGRWKTTRLKSDILCSIPSGEAPGKVTLKYDDDNILEISFKIGFFHNNIYIADNNLKVLHLLNKNGDPLIYIGDKKYKKYEKSGVKFSKFKSLNKSTFILLV